VEIRDGLDALSYIAAGDFRSKTESQAAVDGFVRVYQRILDGWPRPPGSRPEWDASELPQLLWLSRKMAYWDHYNNMDNVNLRSILSRVQLIDPDVIKGAQQEPGRAALEAEKIKQIKRQSAMPSQ
jgi:hypothetical protein